MKIIVSIAGARPQFIKAFITIKSIKRITKYKNILIHTGQHFDYRMSKIFFNELKYKKDLIEIKLKKKTSRIPRISEMINKLYFYLKKINPSLIIVYGDTDTTLAAAIVSRRLKIKLMHVEAGLRSNQINMPEEQNRYIADFLSDYLVVPTKSSLNNLSLQKYNKKIFNFGDVMYDSIIFYKKFINRIYITNFKKKYGLYKKYVFLTIHRDNNSEKKTIKKILEHISTLKFIFFWPIHPKIEKIIKKNKIKLPKNILLTKPISYLDTICALKESLFVVTDSGGVQKEAYFLGKKSFVLREETEWHELVKANAVKLIGNDISKIKKNRKFTNSRILKINEFGNGKSTVKIAKLINKII